MDPARALQRAFATNNVDEIRELLETDAADVNSRDVSHGLQTVLMRLCHLHLTAETRAGILNIILTKKSKVNLQDSTGRSALAHACIAEKADIVEALAGVSECDPNISDNDGNTPLMYAVKSRKVEMVATVLQCFKHRGLDVDHTNNKGLNALMEAKNRCDSDICKLLVKEGDADLSLVDGQFSRDSRSSRTPRSRSPPLETATCVSPRLARKRNRPRSKGESPILSPLVITSKMRQSHAPDIMPLVRSSSLQTPDSGFETDRKHSSAASQTLDSEESYDDDDDNLLSDVQEEDEVDHCPSSPNQDRRRRNSLSLPDLRDLTSASASPNLARNEQLLRRRDNDFNTEKFVGLNPQNRICINCNDGSLPKLSEEEEMDQISEESGYLNRRRGSASLPDLRDGNVCLVGSPRDTAKSSEEEYDETYLEDLEVPESNPAQKIVSSFPPAEELYNKDNSLRLPQLDLNTNLGPHFPAVAKQGRNGFKGNHLTNASCGSTTLTPRRTAKSDRSNQITANLQLRGAKLK